MATTDKVPSHLDKPGKAWFRGLLEQFTLEAWQHTIATLAAEALDRSDVARKFIKLNGQSFVDHRGNTKPYPQVRIVETAAATHRQLVRELHLGEVDKPEPHSRSTYHVGKDWR